MSNSFNLRDWYFLKWQQRTVLSVTVCSKVKIQRLRHKYRHCLENKGYPQSVSEAPAFGLHYSSAGSNADQTNPDSWMGKHPTSLGYGNQSKYVRLAEK